jgi:DNA-binding CsgD family transcriptional regulator
MNDEEKRITNYKRPRLDHRSLQEQERRMKNANMAKRIAVIRLIMQGYLGIQVAELLNIHRETVSIYVQKCKFANYLFCTLANYFGLEYTYKIRSTGFTWSGGHVRLVA